MKTAKIAKTSKLALQRFLEGKKIRAKNICFFAKTAIISVHYY